MYLQIISAVIKYRRLIIIGISLLSLFANFAYIGTLRHTIKSMRDEQAIIAAMADRQRQENIQALARYNQSIKSIERRRNSVIGGIENARNNNGVGAADFIGMLCNQGAAGCSSR